MIVRWTRRPLGDLHRAAEQIAADNPLAAAAFLAAVQHNEARLHRLALLGRGGTADDKRELVVRRNYLVTYHVRGHEVRAVQVWHLARARQRGPAK